MEGYDSDTAIADLSFISSKDQLAYTTAGLDTVADIIERFPKRYEDRSIFDAFPLQAGAGSCCLRGNVIDARVCRFGSRGGFFEAVIEDTRGGGVFDAGRVTCRWFNMPWMKNILAAGQEVILYGKPKELSSKNKDHAGRLVMDHPDVEVITEDSQLVIHLDRIVPIYRGVTAVSQKKIREHVYHILSSLDTASVEDSFNVDESYPKGEAIREIHFPESLEQAQAARRYFALQEFFLLQLNVLWKRQRYRESEGRVMGKKTKLLTKLYHDLPYDLTGAQKRSVKEIIGDMREPYPMSRMLQGDVGSGKTLVALCSMLLAVDSGVQAALMAPTQILAEQHYLTFCSMLEGYGVNLSLRTSSRKDDLVADGDLEPQIIVGTHALLYDEVVFNDLGFVVIDEQHKFGVQQRAKLMQQGVMPDVLMMTATPIPRSLTLTMYGDLDVSILDERPAGRGAVITGVRVKPKVSDITKFIKSELAGQRQVYIVYPLVEESDKLNAASVVVEHAKWQKRLLKYKVGLLHGKMSADEKEEVMRRYRDGEIHVLVSTTVIEVGVDVPNANVMVIYNSERFGLAQLHQLRGRIGRGEHKSYCVLVTDGKNSESMEKLKVLEASNDGFKIAEEDLRLRGPGDVLGTAQSGLAELRFVDFLADTALIREARQLAENLLTSDPMLMKHPDLKQKMILKQEKA